MNYNQTLTLSTAILIILLPLVAVGFYYIKLKKSEELWKFALDGAGNGVWDWDINTDEAHFSDRYKKLLGFNDNDINSNIKEWNNRVHP